MQHPLLLTTATDRPVTTKSEYVYRVLRENIISGNLRPGTRLGQKWIAEQLQVSEIPVREAIKRLQAEGLVTVIPHAGAEVAKLDPLEMEEVLAIRAVLEGLAARTAAERIGPEDIVELEELLKQMDECVKRKDAVTYGLLNQEFHKMIFSLSPYKRLLKMIDELWYGAERSRSVFILDPSRLEASRDEHRALVEALRNHDADKAEQLTKQHRYAAARSLLRSLTEGGEKTELLAAESGSDFHGAAGK
ncbi:MAG: GntR family transcriptional regulator [Firmicutes bacterium]|nr:GntR family transcriptional regulator [Candidatus Fermentithermobacillaceae bacterium]